jgi:hypothetical protein
MIVQLRTHENGGVCCSSTNDAGERIPPKHPCDKCKQHFAAIALRESLKTQEGNMKNDYPLVDSYAADTAKWQEANATQEWRFEAQQKALRLRELDAERARYDAWRAEQPALRVLSADELKKYAAPDPYREGIEAWRRENNR